MNPGNRYQPPPPSLRPVSPDPETSISRASTEPADPDTTEPDDTLPTSPETSPEDSNLIPCPCQCACGNKTSHRYNEPGFRMRFAHTLRCKPCAAEHPNLGTITNPTRTPRPARTPEQQAADKQWGIEQDRLILAELQAERRAEAKQRFLDRCPERWKRWDEDDRLLPQIEDRLNRWRTGTGRGATSLVLFGENDSGKTWNAYTYILALVREDLIDPRKITYGTENDVLGPITYAGYSHHERLQELLSPNTDVIFLDDVGTIAPKYPDREFRHALYANVIDWVYSQEKTLVMTTNLRAAKGGALNDWIGEAAFRRLSSMLGAKEDPETFGAVKISESKRAHFAAQREREYQATKTEKPGTST